ncbi:diguanylate cyclase [Tuwongella immobilis]|uniref:diguanylate cyclase n=1 Tax=Tuwongella immobilis TaxID=692036 RepID=UPI0013A69A67|nr:diguanylate cyclase [Tuwongella immobilis]
MNVQRLTLLIVDDEPAILQIISVALQDEYDILLARHPEDAIRILGTQPVHVLLVDQRMPRMTGVQLLEWAARHTPRIVRILMSGAAQLEDAVAAINEAQVSRFLLKPLRVELLRQTLRSATRELMLEQSHEQLLAELRRVNLELEQRVQDRTLELELANRQLQQRNILLQKMALTDVLTNLPNRRGTDRLARAELLRRARTQTPMVLGLIDIDHFKRVNSRYLHSGGDHLLIWLAQLLSSLIRPIDSIGRVGGEEFLLLAPEADDEAARTIGEWLRNAVAEASTSFNGEIIRITISLGLVVITGEAFIGFEAVRHQAALALREAKESGRNRCVVQSFRSDSLEYLPKDADFVLEHDPPPA